MNKKVSIPRACLGIFLVLLIGCDSGSTISVEDSGLTVPVPARLRQVATLNDQTLRVDVTVNDRAPREFPVSNTAENVEVRVGIPKDDDSDVTLAWYAIVDGQKVLLADSKTLVPAGTTELTISDYIDTGARFDADGDERSNLSELWENRNVLSVFDLEVPFRTSFGGVVGELIDNGTDSAPSGDDFDPDPVTSFRLRHDGENLTVYVCGQDQTLIGDTPAANEAYWDDDTIFLYLDASDNSGSTYDEFDDFQFAFVRATEAMIVSKGFNNPFCPDGSCVFHLFFDTSPSCTYELTVVLPLADMNMSLDQPIGFDLEITDDDNGDARETTVAWIGYNDRSDLDPSSFGTIILRQ